MSADSEQTSKGMVLLVDDDPHVIAGMRNALRREPYDVRVATSIEDAFAVLASNAVSVVVSDEHMPDMPGSEFLGVVAQKYPDTTRVILTGAPDVREVIEGINNGTISRFFTKPCNLIDLTLLIRNALNC